MTMNKAGQVSLKSKFLHIFLLKLSTYAKKILKYIKNSIHNFIHDHKKLEINANRQPQEKNN